MADKYRYTLNTKTKQTEIANFDYQTNDITPLLGMEWMKKFNLTIRIIRLDENNQSEKKRVIEKFPDLF